MNNCDCKKEGKQAYEKPELRVIELAAEEVMGIGCKSNVSAGPAGLCASGTGCSVVGS